MRINRVRLFTLAVTLLVLGLTFLLCFFIVQYALMVDVNARYASGLLSLLAAIVGDIAWGYIRKKVFLIWPAIMCLFAFMQVLYFPPEHPTVSVMMWLMATIIFLVITISMLSIYDDEKAKSSKSQLKDLDNEVDGVADAIDETVVKINAKEIEEVLKTLSTIKYSVEQVETPLNRNRQSVIGTDFDAVLQSALYELEYLHESNQELTNQVSKWLTEAE